MNIPFVKQTSTTPKLLVFTGAGLSAPSGLQTFRDHNGLWHNYDPMLVANMITFKENRELVFEFYNKRRIQLLDVEPNNGHKMLADLQKTYGPDRVQICTQNVDDLLERAGCTNVLHVHGRLTEMICLTHGHVWDIGYTEIEHNVRCPKCGSSNVKPGVIFFNEHAPAYLEMDAMFHDNRRNSSDVVLCIGTRFNVVTDTRILGFSKSFNILADLHRDNNIDYYRFDHVIIGDIHETANHINLLVRKQLNERY